MIKILLLMAIIFLIILSLLRWILPFIYRIVRGDSREIGEKFSHVDELMNDAAQKERSKDEKDGK